MLGIMGDNDIQGHFARLLDIFVSPAWCGVWDGLQVSVQTFKTLGLDPDARDVLVWQACQAHQAVLVTANRNHEGPDSLEATLRSQNTSQSLPVVTIADPDLVLRSRTYAERVAEKILEILMEIDTRRGAGRLWAP